ncbi:hypothetical protein CBOM_05975 [Ceraceosorus bombacis]|uniref:Uncharacterized protein n=1 Tax=Ceraceosorus bombacis TaxID=401625 RepID=A0A0P1BK31_9BASI|nr:hypothetical protein CBOM_05975 [Ceraceosorus bombacis]
MCNIIRTKPKATCPPSPPMISSAGLKAALERDSLWDGMGLTAAARLRRCEPARKSLQATVRVGISQASEQSKLAD